MTKIIICPGIHSAYMTKSFCQAVGIDNAVILPQDLGKFFWQPTTPLIIIGFSAGVVAAMAIAKIWQIHGGKIEALIALDGWGMVLGGDFPIYRLSHDYFTHWSSSLLGAGQENFYAAPAVNHLDLWHSPEKVLGWKVFSTGEKQRCLAVDFLNERL